MKRNYTSIWTTAFLLMTLVATDVSAQQKPTTGYAPVNGIKTCCATSRSFWRATG